MGSQSTESLKADFAQWMRSNLGYQVAALDVPVETETPSGIRYVDIRGETYPTVWQRLH